MLVNAGDNKSWGPLGVGVSELCGPSPIPLGPGRPTVVTDSTAAGPPSDVLLYRAVIVRTRWHQPTIDYVARRTTEGLSKHEIIRCLERYLAREVFYQEACSRAVSLGQQGEPPTVRRRRVRA